MTKRRIVIVLILLSVAIVGITLSAILSARTTAEAMDMMKLYSLAAVISDELENHYRQKGSYPRQLSELVFQDTNVLSALKADRADLDKLSYVSDGKKFSLRWENRHVRFGFSRKENEDLKIEPIANK